MRDPSPRSIRISTGPTLTSVLGTRADGRGRHRSYAMISSDSSESNHVQRQETSVYVVELAFSDDPAPEERHRVER